MSTTPATAPDGATISCGALVTILYDDGEELTVQLTERRARP